MEFCYLMWHFETGQYLSKEDFFFESEETSVNQRLCSATDRNAFLLWSDSSASLSLTPTQIISLKANISIVSYRKKRIELSDTAVYCGCESSYHLFSFQLPFSFHFCAEALSPSWHKQHLLFLPYCPSHTFHSHLCETPFSGVEGGLFLFLCCARSPIDWTNKWSPRSFILHTPHK